MNVFATGQTQKVSWQSIWHCSSNPACLGLVDVRRVYDAKGDLCVSSAYVSQLPLYAGTYDVLDEMFHRKSLLCECREEDPD